MQGTASVPKPLRLRPKGVLMFQSSPECSNTDSPLPPLLPSDMDELRNILDGMERVIAKANAGDPVSEALVRGFAAQKQGNDELAVKYYEEAARQGDVGAMFNAGCTHQDLGHVNDCERWWHAAAQAGHVGAAYNLAVRAGNAGNLPVARHWFQRAAELGDNSGYAALTQIAGESNDPCAEFHWAKLGAEAGHPFCVVRYAQLITKANPGDREVLHQVHRMLEHATETGDVEVMFMAGLVNGQLGDLARSLHLLLEAERNGHPRARHVIENMDCSPDSLHAAPMDADPEYLAAFRCGTHRRISHLCVADLPLWPWPGSADVLLRLSTSVARGALVRYFCEHFRWFERPSRFMAGLEQGVGLVDQGVVDADSRVESLMMVRLYGGRKWLGCASSSYNLIED